MPAQPVHAVRMPLSAGTCILHGSSTCVTPHASARRNEGADILILARTDARQAVSMEEAMWRAAAFAGAVVLTGWPPPHREPSLGSFNHEVEQRTCIE